MTPKAQKVDEVHEEDKAYIGTPNECSTQTEGVLRDVIKQLDVERSKRAELEAKLRTMSESYHTTEQVAMRDQDNSKLLAEVQSLRSEVAGLKHVIDAVTLDKKAIAYASSQEQSSEKRQRHRTLPVHVVRLLEFLPWDVKAMKYIVEHVEVLQWQAYDKSQQKWQGSPGYFPPRIRNLPVGAHSAGVDSGDQALVHVLLSDLASENLVTDKRLTKRLILQSGFSVPPEGGVWQWVGGWQVPNGGPEHDYGWKKGQDACSFLNEDVLDPPTLGGVEIEFRCRKWRRKRMLVDYPMASERTRHCLKVLLENQRLSLTTAKLSDQLALTKGALTEAETRLQVSAERYRELKSSIDKGLYTYHGDDEDRTLGSSSSSLHGLVPKTEQVKDFGSKLAQWVHAKSKNSEDSDSVNKSNALVDDEGVPKRSDRSRTGRHRLIERLARGPVSRPD